MKRYFLFDSILQSEKAPSLAIAARSLLEFLNLEVPSLKEVKADVGSEVMALNKHAFIERNAYTLSLCAKEGGALVCVENSAFISLQMTKEALSNEPALRDAVALRLSQKGLELNFQVDILTFETFLINEVGMETLASLVKHPLSDFYVAHFFGTSFCQARKFTDLGLTCKLLSMIQAKKVTFDSCYESDGFEVLDVSEKLAYQLASTTMLDMFDHAADMVLVDDVRSFIMFDFYQKALEKTASREIALPVLSLAQILLLAFGVHDKAKLGLDKHKIPVTLI
jgi:succinate dehydrogenase / fumarate reductase cytochrome b subunit